MLYTSSILLNKGLNLSATTSTPNIRFHSLDSLRGIAAIWIVFFHLYSGKGYLAVDFFLVLSGFILTHRYWTRETSSLEFVKHRLSRLYPMHLYSLLALTAVTLLTERTLPEGGAHPLFTFIQNLTITNNIGLNPHGPLNWNFPSWSVSVELFVNLIFIFFIPKNVRNGVLFCISLLGLLVIFANCCGKNGMLDISYTNYYGFLNSGIIRGLVSFVLGILAYRIYLYYKEDQRFIKNIDLLKLGSLSLLAVILILSTYNTDLDFFAPYSFMLLTVCFAFDHGVIGNAVSKLNYLGTISYSLYLNQALFFVLFDRTAIPYIFFPLFIILMIAYASLTYRYVEVALGQSMLRFISWVTARQISDKSLNSYNIPLKE